MLKIENKLRQRRLLYNFAALFISCVLVIGFVYFFNNQSVFAENVDGTWSWTRSIPTVYSSMESGDVSAGLCNGSLQFRDVEGALDKKSICMSKPGVVNFGSYYDYGPKNVVGFSNDDKLYRVNGACSTSDDCLYLPETDILVTKQNLINGYVKSLVVYKNFSKRLQRTKTWNLVTQYNFDYSNPEYVFKSKSGYAWPVGSFAASENGKWLAVELRERGTGLLDIENMTMKWISASSLRYGVGFNPTVELAVSDTGLQVIRMGVNSGFEFLDLNEECGEEASDAAMTSGGYFPHPCRIISVDFSKIIDGFFVGSSPRFSNDGAELTFYAGSYSSSSREVVLRANGFISQRIDYLALGDSFQSGEGETDDKYYLPGTNNEFEKCHVSSRSYPFLISELSGIQPSYMRNVACSGATTKDIISDGKIYNGQGQRLGVKGSNLSKANISLAQTFARYNFIPGRINQKNFVENYKPGVITIGIGGNDVGLVEKLKACISDETCSYASDSNIRSQVAAEIKLLYPKLVDTYQTLHNSSLNSRIFVIGYPKMIQEDGKCSTIIEKLLNPDERRFMNESISYLNQIIKAAAKTVGVKFVENYNTFGGQVLCGDFVVKAANGIELGDDSSPSEQFKDWKIIGAEGFHPNPVGFKLIADNILSKIGSIDTAEVCSDGRIVCPVTTLPPAPSSYWKNISTKKLPSLKSEQLIDEPEINSDLLTRNVNLNRYSLLPDSTVEISVYSDKTILGQFSVEKQGGLSVAIQLPADLKEGYHTVHVVGSSYSGEPIDLYQVIGFWHDDIILKNDTVGQTPIIPTIISQNSNLNKIDDNKNESTATYSDESYDVAVENKTYAAQVKGAGVSDKTGKLAVNVENQNYLLYFSAIPIVAIIFVIARKTIRFCWNRN